MYTSASLRQGGLRSLAYVATFALLVSVVRAHEHHEEDIPAGEGISPDPIVCDWHNSALPIAVD